MSAPPIKYTPVYPKLIDSKNLMVWNPAPTSQMEQREASAKNMRAHINPVTLSRVRQDIETWKEWYSEAENAWYPHRVRMQQGYNSVVINGQVTTAMETRKNLTLLRDFAFYDGETIDEKTTALFKSKWFYDLQGYCLDAQAFGYTLVGLGDLINNSFPKMELIKRWNISPDRENETSLIYQISGINFNDPNDKDDQGNSYYDWSIWVPTTNEIGVSKCGYGYLAKVALCEIFIRNNLSFNAKFVEVFAQPYRVGKTNVTEGVERDLMEQALRDIGSNSYAMIQENESIEFMEGNKGGKGHDSYDNLEGRMNKMVSKMILGHADAIDSTQGKLGSGNGTEDAPSPVAKALSDKQVTDGRFMEAIMIEQIVPKLQKIGFPIPMGRVFKYRNDKEKQDLRRREDESNETTATVVKTLSEAGYEVDEKYITDRTGIPVKKKEVITTPETKDDLEPSTKEKLKNLYANNIK